MAEQKNPAHQGRAEPGKAGQTGSYEDIIQQTLVQRTNTQCMSYSKPLYLVYRHYVTVKLLSNLHISTLRVYITVPARNYV